jgi:uncharacterized protein YbjT (DUF2867 family)
MATSSRPQRILVTGATGYIGGRLIPCLLEEGYDVRCFARSPERLAGRPWENDVEIVRGDALDYDTIAPALDGVDVVYYLIHSLGSGEDTFSERDRRAADNFGRAAREQGVDRIIYLGGIQPKGERESEHLRSRVETGEHLRASGVAVTEFRAAVIVGSGSLSFELIRYLTERVPVLICPKWVRTPTQPIAIRNVLQYLVEALEVPESRDKIIEIGGEDVLSYRDMFEIYAQVRGLNRLIVDVPVLTPRLSSLWVGLVTPISTAIAKPLIKGLDNEVVVTDDAARRLFSVDPTSYEAAVRLALRRFATDDVETSWHTAFSSSMDDHVVETLDEEEGMIKERRRLTVDAPPDLVFDVIRRIGGDTGWLYANPLWKIRGLMDLMVGGIGLRKSRRSYSDVRVGDAIDFWRVEAVEEERLLRLRAEMKVPGKAWLQFRVDALDDGRSRITQTAFYEPKGLFGLLYWWMLYPAHKLIFPGMIREIGRRAEVAALARQTKQLTSGTAPAP